MTKLNYVLATPDTRPPAPWAYWVVEDRLLAGPYPGSAEPESHRAKIQTILDAGIGTFVNLMEEAESNHDGQGFVSYEATACQLASRESVFHRFPIADLGIPEPDVMASALNAIDESLQHGRGVYVHCWGGVGRTGTVIGCWLLRHGLATRDNVLTELAQLRKQDQVRGCREAPETEQQRKFVRAWTS